MAKRIVRLVIPPEEIDISTICQFRDAMTNACQSPVDQVRIEVDFANVRFCDATVIRVLTDAMDAVREQGCEIAIINPTHMLVVMADELGLSERLGLRGSV